MNFVLKEQTAMLPSTRIEMWIQLPSGSSGQGFGKLFRAFGYDKFTALRIPEHMKRLTSPQVPSHFDANDTLDLVKQQIDKQLQEMEQLQVVRLQLQVQSDVRQNLQNDLSSKLDEIGIQKACYRSKQREILEKKEQDEEGLNRQKQEFKTIADRLKSLLKEHQDLIREIEAEKLKQETAYTASLRHEEQIKRLKERQAYFMVLTPKKVGKKSAERGRQRDTGADNEMAREMERRRQAATEVLQQARAEKVKMSASATVNALTDSVARVGLQDRGGPGPNAAQAMARRHYESLPTSPSSGAAALLPMEAPATIFESGPIAGSSGPRLSADVTSVKSAQT
ncbi:hypothetical protein CPB83DRAFT_426051 [Crepidotus variabilis]|uniref:Uncharacterized protein n=1 Tax=Crepidotus variabilis TaxID=179855 RepID=A0A9P6EEA8_9AGAR|nr:hypothetical protein CPB83DRAFT_426051 [Crepidotus variabilis]